VGKRRKKGEKNTKEKQPKDKKTIKTYFQDFKGISKAGYLLVKYVFKKTPLYTSVYTVSAILLAISPFVSIWINSKIIDELIKVATSGDMNTQLLFTYIGLSVLISIVDSLFGSVNSITDVNMWFEVGKGLDFDVVRKIAYLDLEHYDTPETNDKLNKVKQNMRSRPQQFLSHFFYFIQEVVAVISALWIFLFFSPLIIIIIVVTSLPLLTINLVYGRRIWGIWDAKGGINRDYSWSRSYLMRERSLMELRISKAREFLLKRLENLYDLFQKEEMKLQSKRLSTQYFAHIFGLIGRTAGYLIIVFAVIGSEITVGQFSFYTGTLWRLQRSFRGILRRISRMYENGLFLVDMYEFLGFEKKIINGHTKLPKEEAPFKIDIKNVSFHYPSSEKSKDKIYALKNLSLKIDPGEHVAIVGENGAGKTTLLKLLLRFYDPTKGHISINGVDAREIDLDSWYSEVGVLFQSYNFYHFTARENIGIGDPMRIEDLEGVIEASKQAKAHDFIEKYANRYDQILNKSFEDGITPSVGQRQRIALARAFFKNPSILILDEPTSAIDPKAEYEIFERLFEFAQDKTVIIISHRFSTVRNASRIVVLDEGSIVEEGTHEELMKIKGGKYQNAFELQSKGYK